MVGRCAECGLDLEWTTLFTHVQHPWLLEYHWRRRPLRSALRTLAMSIRPRRFWSSVTLRDPVHLTSAALLALAFVIMPAVVRAVGVLSWLLADQRVSGGMPWQRTTGVLSMLSETAYLSIRVHDTSSYSYFHWLVEIPQFALWWFALAWMPLTALTYLLIPISLKRVRVQPGHIRRIATYGIIWMTLPMLLLAAVESAGLLLNACSLLVTTQPFYWAWPTEFPLAVGPVPTLPFIYAGFAFVWWDTASRHYLKLPDGRLAAALLTLMTFLLMLGGYVALATALGEYAWYVDNL